MAFARALISITLLVAFFSSAALAEKRVALIIGNGSYANAPKLDNPKNDAEDMAAALRDLGFSVILGVDLDKREMDRKVQQFASALSGADVGVFHYSGHGLQVAGVNYLVPIDAELATASALDFEAVRLDLVQRTMERETKTNILFLDACRNNPFTRSLARALGTRAVDIGRGLAPVEGGVGTLISFSTQPGNVALDGTGRNSPYSGPLARTIGTPGEDILSVLTGVRNQVLAATDERQVPWENHALRSKFYFASAQPVPPQPQTSDVKPPLSDPARVWADIKDSKDVEIFEVFRKQYGSSSQLYDTLASQRIAELKRTQVAIATPVPPALERSGDITGAGATFPYPIFAQWSDISKKELRSGLNYQAIGSGGGIKQIAARTVTFGASDVPLTSKELTAGGDLMQWPMVMSGIVPIVNIDGIPAGKITLDGATLAKIFLGEIRAWDDPALKKLNPNVSLPSAPITAVHRSDGSGTTFYFTNYLAKSSADWKSKAGSSTSVVWPAGIGAKGNEGVANTVKQSKNSIGYVEMAYAKQYNLTTAKMVNRDGMTVEANAVTVQAAAANADWEHSDGLDLILTDQPGARTWPISAATYVLMPKHVPNAAAAQMALNFFAWAYANGDNAALALDYIPMPVNVKRLVQSRWGEIRGADGKPVSNIR